MLATLPHVDHSEIHGLYYHLSLSCDSQGLTTATEEISRRLSRLPWAISGVLGLQKDRLSELTSYKEHLFLLLYRLK
jgi:hypothetical protein